MNTGKKYLCNRKMQWFNYPHVDESYCGRSCNEWCTYDQNRYHKTVHNSSSLVHRILAYIGYCYLRSCNHHKCTVNIVNLMHLLKVLFVDMLLYDEIGIGRVSLESSYDSPSITPISLYDLSKHSLSKFIARYHDRATKKHKWVRMSVDRWIQRWINSNTIQLTLVQLLPSVSHFLSTVPSLLHLAQFVSCG